MYIVSVTVRVKPEAAGDFVEATLENARRTRGESGNLRFDVARCVDEAARFLLYEVYASQDDFAAHQQTDHYLRWRETVADWMAQPREGVKHSAIFFGDDQVR